MTQTVEVKGIGAIDFPDDMSEDDIKATIRRKFGKPITREQALEAGAKPGIALTPEQIIKIRNNQKITPNEPMLDENKNYRPFQSPEVGTQGESFLSGAKYGATAIGAGLAKGIAGLTGNDRLMNDISQTMNFETAKNKTIGQDYPVTNLMGQIAGETGALPTLGPMGKGKLMRVLTAGGAGAVAGGLSAAGRNEDVLDNMLISAGIGGGLQALSEPFAAMVRRLKNAKAGQFKRADIDELIKTAQEQGIPIYADDLGNPHLAKLGTNAENIPITGTMKGRKVQNEAQRLAAQRMRDKFAEDIDDFGVAVQGEMRKHLNKARSTAGRLFTRASRDLDPLGQIPKKNFHETILNEYNRYYQRLGKAADKNVLKKMEDYFEMPVGDFTTMRAQRSKIASDISDFYTGKNTVIGEDGVRILQRAKDALEADIESFARNNLKGESLRRWKMANDFYRRNVVDFKETQLRQLIATGEPEKLLAFLTGSKNELGRSSRGKLFYRNITPRGRRAIRGAIVDQAFQKGNMPDGHFSPAKFASELEHLQNVTGVIFKGRERAELNGLTKLMRATQRAGQIFENPPTGNRLTGPGVILAGSFGLTGDLGTSVLALGGWGAAAKTLLQSKTGRNLLYGLSKSTENTKAADQVMRSIQTLLERAAITTQIENRQNENE